SDCGKARQDKGFAPPAPGSATARRAPGRGGVDQILLRVPPAPRAGGVLDRAGGAGGPRTATHPKGERGPMNTARWARRNLAVLVLGLLAPGAAAAQTPVSVVGFSGGLSFATATGDDVGNVDRRTGFNVGAFAD